jgi:hypothetical protein
VVVFQPYKHYHAKAVDLLVREGCMSITKLEFLGIIRDIRKETFKTSTILSAFKKTGIHPYDPHSVLEAIYARRPVPKTPSPPPPASSGITPVTIRTLRRTGQRLLDNSTILETSSGRLLERFIKGSIIQSTELLQVKRDLSRTQMAAASRKARRNEKNMQLQSGGILTVSDGRRMVRQNAEAKIVKATAIVAAAQKRETARRKRVINDAAKAGRAWKRQGRFKTLESAFFWPPGPQREWN